MFSATTLATLGSWLAFFQPLLTAFFNAFGSSLNQFLANKQADQNAKDLGNAEANNATQQATIEAQQSELDAQENAPKTVDDAVKRLEEGSA